MEDQSSRREFSGQLAAWWRTQTEFKTQKALAGFLKLHRDTIGDYFSGKRFPKPEIASRIYELTRITCLKPNASGSPSSGTALQVSSPMLSALPSHSIATPIEGPPAPVISSPPVVPEDKYNLGKSLEGKPGQLAREVKKGERNMEKPVVISLQRTSCPFCTHGIVRFRSCGYCGQSFVWANVPIGHGEPS